jgi:hypothetical protein
MDPTNQRIVGDDGSETPNFQTSVLRIEIHRHRLNVVSSFRSCEVRQCEPTCASGEPFVRTDWVQRKQDTGKHVRTMEIT